MNAHELAKAMCENSFLAVAPEPRKTYILLCVEDGEPTMVEPYHTIGDAAARFRAILDEEPDFLEYETIVPQLRGIVARALNQRGDMLLIVERMI